MFPTASVNAKTAPLPAVVLRPFKTRDVFVLNGDITADGGDVKVSCKNGTQADTTITFSAEYKKDAGSPEVSAPQAMAP